MTHKAKTWVTIPDKNVRHIWANPDGTGEIRVSPSCYQDSGTPICDDDSGFEGDDMTYVRTEIRSGTLPQRTKAQKKVR